MAGVDAVMPKVVVAIDFGTTFTGYAYTSRTEFKKSNEAREIFHNRWASQLAGMLSKKAPTVALFDPHHNFHSFGYEAEEKYSELAEGKQHHDWHYYRRFKMLLYGKMNIHRDLEVVDQFGRPYNGQVVFYESIKYLKEKVIDEMKECLDPVAMGDILWVLTVPAIWNEPAKQFMRAAAAEAGIRPDKLRLALEPEAAAMYCRSLPQGTFKGIARKDIVGYLGSGSRYVILDMGGGTVDIAVHEVAEDGTLIEILPASGGDWGGTSVDRAFSEFITETIGMEDSERLQKTKTDHWMALENNFEVQKRTLKYTNTRDIRLKIPPVLIIESKLNIKAGMSYKMDITSNTFKSFFRSTKDIVDHVKYILARIKGINLILMVGGYSQSDYVSNLIKREFSDMTFLVPPQSELAVLDGAVMFGFEPWTMSARMCRHTYGVQVIAPFIPGIHDPKYRCEDDGLDYCGSIFRTVVTQGEILKINEMRETKNLYSTHCQNERKYLHMKVNFFALTTTEHHPSDSRHIIYTTDDFCCQIGTVTIHPPAAGWPEKVNYSLKMYFGRTEVQVKVFNDADRTEYKATFDMLTNKDVPSVPHIARTTGVQSKYNCVMS